MLAKDSVAQCASVMVGRAVMDIDVNRAAETMGFAKTGKKAQALKQFDDGEFHFFGPAFETIALDGTQDTVHIGSTKTKPIQIGKPAPPHPPTPKAIAKLTKGLESLPERAHAEIVDLVQAKTRIRDLEKELSDRPQSEPAITDEAVFESIRAQADDRGFTRGWQLGRMDGAREALSMAIPIHENLKERIEKLFVHEGYVLDQVENVVATTSAGFLAAGGNAGLVVGPADGAKASGLDPGETDRRQINATVSSPVKSQSRTQRPPSNDDEIKLNRPERKFLQAMSRIEFATIPTPWRKVQICFLAGYKPKSSTTANTFGSLRSKGLIEYVEGGVIFTDEGRTAVGPDHSGERMNVVESVKALLNGAEKKFLEQLVESHPEAMTKIRIADQSGYSFESSTTANTLGRLRSLQIITYPAKGWARAADWLFS
jgi:hypothetical protein